VVARQDATFGEIVLMMVDAPEALSAEQGDEDDLTAAAQPEE
jgi:hypothetical protein